MNIADVEAFVAVVQRGSIKKASETLHVTQSGVTRRLQQLELSLGVQLLDRQSKPAVPTPVGLKVYAQSLRLLTEARGMRLVSQARLQSPVIKIGFSTYFSLPFLNLAAAHLREELDRTEPLVVCDTSPCLLERLRTGELDVALMCLADTTRPPDDLHFEHLCRLPIVTAVGKNLGLPPTLSLENAAPFGWILNTEHCIFRDLLRERHRQLGTPFKVNGESARDDYRLQMAAENKGIAFLSPHVMETSRNTGLVATLDIIDFPTGGRLWMGANYQNAEMEAACNVLRELLFPAGLAHELLPGSIVPSPYLPSEINTY